MAYIKISRIKRRPIDLQKVEIVERKCIGHPDTICDALSEEASKALSRYYIKEFNEVHHHNVDKALLVAGKSEPAFRGGKILEPIKVYIAGRAIDKVGRKIVPVDTIVKDAAREYIRRELKIDHEHIQVISEIHPGASNLTDVVEDHKRMPDANDTSFGVGYAPLSDTERFVLKVTDIVRSRDFRKRFPSVGDDIKIMALRVDKKINLTIAIAFIDSFFRDNKDYFKEKERVHKELTRLIGNGVRVSINTLDEPRSKSVDDVYLTVTGLSAEMGDDGETGRGNRVNGLITPNRPMSFEAAAGKNAVSHVGKIYNVAAFELADIIIKRLKKKGVKEVYITILSQIGKPINHPQVLDVELNAERVTPEIKEEVKSICRKYMDSLPGLTKKIIEGKMRIY